MNLLKKSIFTYILLGFVLIGSAQKIYYAPGNEEYKYMRPDDSTTLLYSIYLLGDIKNPNSENKNLELLRYYLKNENKQSAVVILGDILYPLGLRDSDDKHYGEDEKNLQFILNTFKSFDGQVIILPGNHDWAQGKQEGKANLINQEEYTEQYLDRGNVFMPDNGCPGPVEVELTQDITLIAFDSHWWFHKYSKPGSDGDCGFTSISEVFVQIEDALRRNRDKKVIFAAHHPLFSVGNHGGYFSPSDLLFPFLVFNKWMYIPFPGFIYTSYRKYLGHVQDFAHPDYKLFNNFK